MLLRSLPLAGKLVKEIRLKEITAIVIPATLLAANPGRSRTGSVTTGIHHSAAPVGAGDAEHLTAQRI